MHRECGRAESKRRSRVLRGNDFDLGVILNDSLDGIVEDAGDGHIHSLLLGHDVAGVSVLNVAFKDAGRARSVRCMRRVRRVGRL